MSISLCIDLEATCFEECKLEDMEIIEIGVIAIDENGQEIDRFSSLVNPTYTKITEFCYQITEINHSMVNMFPHLPGVVDAFVEWINDLPEIPQIWYSWGSYDLRQWKQDLLRFGLDDPLPDHVNAKKLFQKKMTPGAKQVGLKKALEIVGLKFEGRQHSAEDDACNLAQLFPYYKSSE